MRRRSWKDCPRGAHGWGRAGRTGPSPEELERQWAAANARSAAIHAVMGDCTGLTEDERRARYWAAADIVDAQERDSAQEV